MSASFWNVKRAVIVGGQFDAGPFQKSRRTRPQVDDGIIHSAAGAADEFYFFVRSCLKVHAAQRRRFVVVRQIELGKLRAQAVIGEFLGVPNPRKISPVIVKTIRLDHETSVNVSLGKTHAITPNFLAAPGSVASM